MWENVYVFIIPIILKSFFSYGYHHQLISLSSLCISKGNGRITFVKTPLKVSFHISKSMDNFTGSYHVESVEIVKQDKN